jgi:hypothetical protein
MKYIVSPVTLYDDEQEQFCTKLGVEGKTMPLHYTVWGNSEEESRDRAVKLGEILTKNQKENLDVQY